MDVSNRTGQKISRRNIKSFVTKQAIKRERRRINEVEDFREN